MILVIAGTKDGRNLAGALAKEGYKVMVSVTSQYGQELVQELNHDEDVRGQLTVNAVPLDCEGLMHLIKTQGISLLVDASHPYAANVSQNAIMACETTGITYIRYERPMTPLPAYEHLYQVSGYLEAAETAANLGQSIFLTTGSRHLSVFKAVSCLQNHRLIARVLPVPGVIQECMDVGFQPSDIVALQGPFTLELNMALFTAYGADVIVTKNSGIIGGSDTKFAAAMTLKLPLVVIDRPLINYPAVFTSLEDVICFVRRNYTWSL